MVSEMPASDDIVKTLRAFYQDTIRPDTEQLVLRSEARLRVETQRLGESLRAQIGELQRDIDGHFDALYHRLDRLETEYHMLVEGLRRVEQAIGEGEKERTALRAEVAELRAGVAALAERVKDLEAKVS